MKGIIDLYITEKWPQVEDLAKVLDCKINQKWYPAYNEEKKIAIVPLKGHLYGLLQFPHQYDEAFKLWEEKTILCFPKEFIKEPKKNTLAQLNRTIEHIKDAKNIIIASDFDNEGANLAYTVIKKAGGENKVRRMLEMGSTTEEALKRTLNNPIDIPYKNMSDAGDARAFIDWAEGMTYSRALTVHLAKKKATLIFGGVKAPVIKFVVERDLEFESHSKIKYYTLGGTASSEGKTFDISVYRNIDGKQEKKFERKEHAEQVKNEILEKLNFKLSEFTSKKRNEGPSQLYDLIDVSSEMSKKFNITANNSLGIAQKLYDEYKIQSYPRTAIKYLKDDDFSVVPAYLQNVQKVMHKDIIAEILSKPLPKRTTVFNSAKVTSHGGLTPTEEKKLESLYPRMTELEKGMFDRVATRFVANFMPDYEYQEYKGEIHLFDDIYASFTEKQPLVAGWKLLYNEDINKEIQEYKRVLPETMEKGNEIKIEGIALTEGETKPKPRFTMETLQKAMGNIANLYPEDKILKEELGENGIGTPATIPGILEELFATTDKDGKEKEPWLKMDGKKVVSTPIARELAKVTPEEIMSPVKRAKMFKKIKEIEKGEKTLDEFLAEYKEEMIENIAMIKKLGEDPSNVVKPKNDKEKLGECPTCGTGEIYETPKAYICTNAQWKKDDNGKWSNDGCQYSIFKKQLERFGKSNITKTEVIRFLKNKTIKLKLKNQNTKESYDAELVYDAKYGLGFPAKAPSKEVEVIGNCPFCDGNIVEKDKTFACTNAKWEKNGDKFENKGCTFQIIKGKFKKQGKENITKEEVRFLLENGELEVELSNGIKKVKADLQWGLSWA